MNIRIWEGREESNPRPHDIHPEAIWTEPARIVRGQNERQRRDREAAKDAANHSFTPLERLNSELTNKKSKGTPRIARQAFRANFLGGRSSRGGSELLLRIPGSLCHGVDQNSRVLFGRQRRHGLGNLTIDAQAACRTDLAKCLFAQCDAKVRKC